MRCSLRLLTCVVNLIPLLAFSVTFEEVEKLVKERLKETYGDRVKLKNVTVYAKRLPKEGKVRIRVQVSEGNPRGRAVLLIDTGESTRLVTVGIDLLWRCEVLVASEDLRPGDRTYPWVLSRENLYLPRCPRDLPGDLVNYTVTRSVRKGEVLRKTHLRKTPLVRSGEEVRVTLKRGNLEITLRGRSLDTGFLGDTVRVRVGATGKILKALVVGEGSVELRPDL